MSLWGLGLSHCPKEAEEGTHLLTFGAPFSFFLFFNESCLIFFRQAGEFSISGGNLLGDILPLIEAGEDQSERSAHTLGAARKEEARKPPHLTYAQPHTQAFGPMGI